MFANSKSNPHAFHVISNWPPPHQQSVALENYLERTKLEIANIVFSVPLKRQFISEAKTNAQSP